MEVLHARAVVDVVKTRIERAQRVVDLGERRAHVSGGARGAVDGVSLSQRIARRANGAGSVGIGRATTQTSGGIRALLVHAGIEVGHFGVGRGQLRAVDGIGTAGADTASGHIGDGAFVGVTAYTDPAVRGSTASIGIGGTRDGAGRGGHGSLRDRAIPQCHPV
ncbi:hypothetical protein D3C80_987450 [compost metagenome]